MKEIINGITKKSWHINTFKKIEELVARFTIAEKSVFFGALIIFALSSVSLLLKVNDLYLVEIPTYGGELTEGIVGTPRFANPLLAISDADRDITSLVYSGLMRVGSNGKLIPDLAESVSVSDDGLTYVFKIKASAFWSDGQPVTSDDVEFTIQKAQDSALKSPRRASWEGITVLKNGDKEVTMKLRQSYSPFLENTTMGILPKHIWQSIEDDQFPFSQFNVEPVGAGPFKVSSINRNSSGIPNYYTLSSRKNYVLGRPYLDKITVKFYQNETLAIEAYKNADIDSMAGISPEFASNLKTGDEQILRAPLARIFGIFFNQNQNDVLVNKEVRQALDMAIDRQKIINEVLYGFGTVATGPVPSNIIAPVLSTTTPVSVTANTASSTVETLLWKNGWKKNPTTGILEKTVKKQTSKLSLSISTANTPELVRTARLVEESWKALGVGVEIRIFELSDLNQSVIRPRKYNSLLFGTITGRQPDLYAFWHSSQRNDPGLNIAMYTNAKADKILEDMRKSKDETERNKSYSLFNAEIKKDIPALFLYTPDFIYVVPKNLSGVHLDEVVTPSDRFANVYQWFMRTDKVWSIFTKNNN